LLVVPRSMSLPLLVMVVLSVWVMLMCCDVGCVCWCVLVGGVVGVDVSGGVAVAGAAVVGGWWWRWCR